MNPEAAHYIQTLDLKPHPEGGYYREVYRADDSFSGNHLPERYNKLKHSFGTSIYFLLEGRQVSRFHRLKSDELWYYHAGTQASVYIIDERGELETKNIGKSGSGVEPQVIINKNSWFCAEVEDKASFILVGCSVFPGFEFSDFEMGERESLLSKFPKYTDLIRRFT